MTWASQGLTNIGSMQSRLYHLLTLLAQKHSSLAILGTKAHNTLGDTNA